MSNSAELYKQVDEIIDNLSGPALEQLVEGFENDIDSFIDALVRETQDIIASPTRTLQGNQFMGLEKVTESVEETLRSKSMAYFVNQCLPNFTMGWHHIEWMNLVQIHKLLNVLAARDHSKSYTFSHAFPLWQMYRYRPRFTTKVHGGRRKQISPELWRAGNGLLVTNEQSLARHLLKLIKEEVESNPILAQRLLPEGRKKEGWGSDALVAKTGASLITKSSGSRARGLHCDWIVMDDFLDESSLYSSEQRDKFFNLFSGVFKPILNPGGQMIICGTPFHNEDLYHTLRKQGVFKCFEYPAIFPNGEMLFPQRHSIQSLLQQRKTLGSLIFSREILVRPITDNTSIFPYVTLNRAIKGQDNVVVSNNIDSVKRRIIKLVIGCDFATSARLGADYSVFTILGVDEFEHFHVLNSIRLHGAKYSRQIQALRKINRDFRPDLFYVEDNGMQKVFVEMIEDAGLPVVGRTTNARNKKSLYEGVPSLAVLFETGRIHFPYGDEKSRNMTDLYFSELNSIAYNKDSGKLQSTDRHDDTSMSLWQAVSGAKSSLSDDFDFSFV